MVSLSKFEALIAPSLDISKPVLDKRNRELKKEGLLPGAGEEGKNAPRGVNAPNITSEDAVWVLLAATCAKTPKETPDAVRKLANMKASDEPYGEAKDLYSAILRTLTDKPNDEKSRTIRLCPNLGKAELIEIEIKPQWNDKIERRCTFKSSDYDEEREFEWAVLSYELPEGLLRKVREQIGEGEEAE